MKRRSFFATIAAALGMCGYVAWRLQPVEFPPLTPPRLTPAVFATPDGIAVNVDGLKFMDLPVNVCESQPLTGREYCYVSGNDDAARIQAAIDLALAGWIVSMPTQSYMLTRTVVIDKTVKVKGGNWFKVPVDAPALHIRSGAHGVLLSNVVFDYGNTGVLYPTAALIEVLQ
jgi:hypothetical protein